MFRLLSLQRVTLFWICFHLLVGFALFGCNSNSASKTPNATKVVWLSPTDAEETLRLLETSNQYSSFEEVNLNALPPEFAINGPDAKLLDKSTLHGLFIARKLQVNDDDKVSSLALVQGNPELKAAVEANLSYSWKELLGPPRDQATGEKYKKIVNDRLKFMREQEMSDRPEGYEALVEHRKKPEGEDSTNERLFNSFAQAMISGGLIDPKTQKAQEWSEAAVIEAAKRGRWGRVAGAAAGAVAVHGIGHLVAGPVGMAYTVACVSIECADGVRTALVNRDVAGGAKAAGLAAAGAIVGSVTDLAVVDGLMATLGEESKKTGVTAVRARGNLSPAAGQAAAARGTVAGFTEAAGESVAGSVKKVPRVLEAAGDTFAPDTDRYTRAFNPALRPPARGSVSPARGSVSPARGSASPPQGSPAGRR